MTSSSSSLTSTAIITTNPVEQLQLLRSFLPPSLLLQQHEEQPSSSLSTAGIIYYEEDDGDIVCCDENYNPPPRATNYHHKQQQQQQHHGQQQQQQHRYSESDLLDCLKISGYNVNRAAELLITGQYQSVHSKNNNLHQQRQQQHQSSSKSNKSAFFQCSRSSRTQQSKSSTKTISSSSSSSVQRKSVPTSTKRKVEQVRQKMNDDKDVLIIPTTLKKTKKDKTNDNNVPAPSISIKNVVIGCTRKQQQHCVIPMTNVVTEATVCTSPVLAQQQQQQQKQLGRVSITPPSITTTTTTSIDSSSSNPTTTSAAGSSTPMNNTSATTATTTTKKVDDTTSIDSHGPYLLCNRWISDAMITSIPKMQSQLPHQNYGYNNNNKNKEKSFGSTTTTTTGCSIHYRESLTIDYTMSGYSMTKFFTAPRECIKNGSCVSYGRIEGRLPENIAILLTPFLRYRPTTPSWIVPSSSPLIVVAMESMIEDNNVMVGSVIPIQMSIYITAPIQDFFHLITMYNNNKTPQHQPDDVDRLSSEQPTYSYHEQSKKRRSSSSNTNNHQNKNKKNSVLSLPEAAYLLFQWAQYGDDIPIATLERKNTNTISNGTINDVTVIDDDDELDKEELDSNESSETDPLLKQQFNEINNTTTTNISWTDTLPDDDDTIKDPIDFQEKNISLRPYQKQALYFMIQRETNGMTSDQLNDQIQFLNELVAEQHVQHKNQSNRRKNYLEHQSLVLGGGSNQKVDIVCDCGPVLVSEKGKSESRTLCGLSGSNIPQHPLWEHRYIASKDRKRTITVFVNELLGVVTHIPPPLPRYCSGGILADAMGLGKTVMLLALILKSKEMRTSTAKQEQKNHEEHQPSAKYGNKNNNKTENEYPRSTTLIVAKLSLLPQWEEELKTKTNLRYKIYYGSNTGKPINLTEYLWNVDVVVTTYGTLQGELRQKYPVLLHCHWLRVILDEAHCIRNHRTLASTVCCQLKADHRWCVTGTIIQNSLDDVYGIMKFLQHEPWCVPSFWNTTVTQLALNDSTDNPERVMKTAIDRIRRVLSPIMIRRTKDSLGKDGVPILTLPPIENKVVKVNLSESEREFYNALLSRSMEVFDGFIKDGTAAKAYFQIFSLLSRLRQSCDHIALTVRSKINDEEWLPSNKNNEEEIAGQKSSNDHSEVISKQFLESLLEKFKRQQDSNEEESKRRCSDKPVTPTKRRKVQAYVSKIANNLKNAIEDNATHIDEECPICLERPTFANAIVTPCGHIFCSNCLLSVVYSDQRKSSKAFGVNTSECPTCQEHFDMKHITRICNSHLDDEQCDATTITYANSLLNGKDNNKPDNQFAIAHQVLHNAISGTTSSKMEAIMNELNNIWALDPGSKVLMFSHYLGFLDLLGIQLKTLGIPYFRLDGSLNVRERMNVLEEFRSTRVNGSVSNNGSSHKGTVLLMSMSAGGEGLNITSASSCFILEPWWNSAKEDQCQNRIHRFGQTASIVRVRKFIVNDSVEERIVELQQRKAYVACEVYNNTKIDSSSHTPMTDLESTRLSLEDFRQLFRSRIN